MSKLSPFLKVSTEELENYRPIPLLCWFFKQFWNIKWYHTLTVTYFLMQRCLAFIKMLAVNKLGQFANISFESRLHNAESYFYNLGKVFDYVSQDILLKNLIHWEFQESSVSLLKSYLSWRKKYVYQERSKFETLIVPPRLSPWSHAVSGQTVITPTLS